MSREEIIEKYKGKIPIIPPEIKWSVDAEGIVTLDIENRGKMNWIAQKLFKKPKVSHIHLDPVGSFVYPLMDGKNTIEEIAKKEKECFGEECKPLYERLLKFFEILESYSFVEWVK